MSNFFSGDSGRSTVTQTVDPSQQRLNDLYFGEALGLKNASGGAAAFGTPQAGLYGFGPAEQDFRRQIIGATSDPGAYSQVLQKMFSQANRSSDYAGEAMDWSRQSPTGQVDLEALNSIRALLGRSLEGPNELESGALRTYGQATDWGGAPVAGQVDLEALNSIRALLGQALAGPNELESGALRSWGSRTDPNEMLSAAERYMNLIGGPEAKAASVAGGMGGVRGGAFQESLARESARLALPILQLINQNVGEFAGAQERTSGALESRRRGLSGDLFQMGGNLESRDLARRALTTQFGAAQERASGALEGRRRGLSEDLFQVGTNIEGRGLARRGFAGQEGARASTAMGDIGQLMPLIDQNRLAMLTAGQQAAAMPRMLALQDFLRQQDVTMSTLLKTPTKTGGTTAESKNQDLTLQSILGPAALFAALMMRPGAK